MPNTKLSVLVNEQHINQFSDVVEKCRQAGLNVQQQMDAIGVITGSIDSAKVDELKKIDGVSRVETQRDIRINPPDSGIQ